MTEAEKFIKELFSQTEAVSAGETAPPTDEELDEQRQALEAERVRRREDVEAQDFGDALVRAAAKPWQEAFIEGLHKGDGKQ